jgi:integrase
VEKCLRPHTIASYLRAFTTALIRDYQAHMATKGERRLPRVLDWSRVEQIVAGERKPRDRAILALLAYGGLRRGEVMAADVGD